MVLEAIRFACVIPFKQWTLHICGLSLVTWRVSCFPCVYIPHKSRLRPSIWCVFHAGRCSALTSRQVQPMSSAVKWQSPGKNWRLHSVVMFRLICGKRRETPAYCVSCCHNQQRNFFLYLTRKTGWAKNWIFRTRRFKLCHTQRKLGGSFVWMSDCYFCRNVGLFKILNETTEGKSHLRKGIVAQCCSHLGIPVVRGEVGHDYRHLYFVFSFLVFSQYVLCQQRPTPSIFAVVLRKIKYT